ncbi:MAG: putative zinc-binding metallopeptidase [Gordonia sp. (in: high G+C Gram-positive bacteria)]
MRGFLCRTCGQRLSFEDGRCPQCRSALGFWLPTRTIEVLDARGRVDVGGRTLRRCANSIVAQCNWLVDEQWGWAALCASCQLTRVRPGDHDRVGLAAFGQVEATKRRILVELDQLGLPLRGRTVDPVSGLAFDLLSRTGGPVTTGHLDGVITLDLSEVDATHRERVRVALAEPYRTVIGHFRHELGHYYQMVLVDRRGRTPDPAPAQRFRELFGDPDVDYSAALYRHYAVGPPLGWQSRHVSAYATMHPVEDFAETFAHYLHLRDTVDTAAAHAMSPPALATAAAAPAGFERLIQWWLPLTWALNQFNRSGGRPALYPFILADEVLDKMRFVHDLVVGAGRSGESPAHPVQ